MSQAIERFLDEVSHRGSWLGGGSAAALSAALSAALLEKLAARPAQRQALQRIRRACVRLIRQDAETFARAVASARSGNRVVFRRRLKAATAVQETVLRHARNVERACGVERRRVKPSFQSDLRCAAALATAAEQSAKALIRANQSWLTLARCPTCR